jgi:CubicO group peptidase (beta-lactamase class C family)
MNRRDFMAVATAAATLALTQRASAAAPGNAELNAFVEEQLKGTGFGGTILVSAHRQTVLCRGYGLADRAFSVPCAADTAYRIASITKLFTATIVMRLWEKGKIDLDATIATYLPDYKGPGASKVKVRQLLNHTSGIENFDKSMTSYADVAKVGAPAYQIPHTPRQLMDLFASGPLVHQPGSAFDYNNADYVILGQLIEAIEHTPFEEVVSRDILKPLAMNSTGMAGQQGIIPRLAPTYYKDQDAPLSVELPIYPQNWYAAGGMYSTAEDLLAFAEGLYGNHLMSPAKLAALLTPGLEEYGFGLWISTLDVNGSKHRVAQRPGRIIGANTLLLRMLDDDVTVVILANTNLVDTDKLGFQIAKHVIA